MYAIIPTNYDCAKTCDNRLIRSPLYGLLESPSNELKILLP